MSWFHQLLDGKSARPPKSSDSLTVLCAGGGSGGGGVVAVSARGSGVVGGEAVPGLPDGRGRRLWCGRVACRPPAPEMVRSA